MLWLVIVLIIVGLLLLLLEVLVIPGTGFAGIAGFASIIGGIWLAYADLGTKMGHYVLALTIGINLLAIWLAFRSKTWKKMALNAKIDGKVNTTQEKDLKVGDEGTTVSRLAPMGKAEINNRFVEVDARTDFIDPGTPIKIVKISGNKIYVSKIDNHG